MNPQPQYQRPTEPHGHDDRLLTITEAADLTRLPVATLRFKRHDRSGPRSFRMGRRVFYWLTDVLAWIEQHYNDDGPRAA
ncbi:MAG: helix-turn-helix transcriptional regulator [Jatrophihabitantaceae bacterium]